MKRILILVLSIAIMICMAGCGSPRDEVANNMNEETSMRMLIDNKEIPVVWEDNDTVDELMAQVAGSDIEVNMSMYSNNEQVGPLGKQYTRNDKQTRTHNGDIVLYNGNQIVVFYGSNSWAYTRLGKMDLSEADVTELLSQGDVTLKLTK